MNILEIILQEMMSDDENTEDQSQRLHGIYHNADKGEREVLDKAFICVCGWSLDTLIGKANSWKLQRK